MARRLPLLVFALLLALPGVAAADVADEIIVRRAPGLTAAERVDLRADAGVRLERALPLADVEVVRVHDGPRADALRELQSDPDVLWAEPNMIRRAATADAHWSSMWGLANTGQSIDGQAGIADADVDAPEAWPLSQGQAATVALVDTGVRLDHPDLAPTGNPGERGSGREANGIDDDGNGKVDDWRGWDWVGDDNDPGDGDGHGTHVAGTIAARENALGVVGVAPRAQLIPLRVLDDDGSGSSADVAAAFAYAGRLGVDVVNASLGSSGSSKAERDAIRAHPGTLFVVAAGNDGTSNDATPHYPCNVDAANVVCVGATDNRDQPADFSNFGTDSVDLFAPGVDIASSFPSPEYVYLSGTSMATPHVAGAAALLFDRDPALAPARARWLLIGSAERKASLGAMAVGDGRLNAAGALAALAAPDETAPAAPAGLAAAPRDGAVELTWAAAPEADLLHYSVRRLVDDAWVTIATARERAHLVSGLANGTPVSLRVTAVDRFGNESAPSATVSATPAPASGDPAPATPAGLGATAGEGTALLDWSDQGEPDLSHFVVQRRFEGQWFVIATTTASAHAVAGLAAGAPASFRVSAVDRAGNESAPSDAVTVTPLAVAASPSVPAEPPAPAPLPVLADPAPAAPAPAGAPPAAPPARATATLGRLRLLGRASACRTRCGGRPATLTFTLGAPASIKVTLSRRACGAGRCAWRLAGRRTVAAVAGGAQRWAVRGSVAGVRLRPGRWRVTLTTAVATRALDFSVTAR